MADVQPFRGIRYNLEQIDDLSALICPPYDVISPEEQLSYHRKSPYNVVRLEFGEERSEDSPQDSRYTRAALTMKSWLRDNIIVREESPAFYLVEHRFPYQDTEKSRFSLIARVRLEDFSSGQIRPHEVTIGEASADRLRLLKSCHANFSPIMGLFRHHGAGILSLLPNTLDRPVLSAVDRHGVGYAMWLVTDKEAIATVSDFFADRTLYIADGHHRYETALAHQQEQRSKYSYHTGTEAFDFVMMTLTDAEDPNLIMEPTHRLVRGLNKRIFPEFGEQLAASCDQDLLSPLPNAAETLKNWLNTLQEWGHRGTTFGLYGLDGLCLRLLTPKQKLMFTDQLSALNDLDVYILHRSILDRMLGISSREMAENCLGYTRDGLEATSRVDSGEYQLAFLLNPTPVSSVLTIADEGARMPQKSTYFHPKTPAGLVINPLWDD